MQTFDSDKSDQNRCSHSWDLVIYSAKFYNFSGSDHTYKAIFIFTLTYKAIFIFNGRAMITIQWLCNGVESPSMFPLTFPLHAMRRKSSVSTETGNEIAGWLTREPQNTPPCPTALYPALKIKLLSSSLISRDEINNIGTGYTMATEASVSILRTRCLSFAAH